MKVGTNESALIHYKPNYLSVNQGTSQKAFSSSDTYTAFSNSTGNITYTRYDAIIYSVYGATAVNPNTTFKKYVCAIDDASYLEVNGKLIKFDSTGDALNLEGTITDKQIEFLYNNYYSRFLLE